MKKDQYCNHDCNQGRDCPVRAGTHKPAEAVLQIQEPTPVLAAPHEAMEALEQLTNALRERHYGRMPEEVQIAYDKAWTIVFGGPKVATNAAPAAVAAPDDIRSALSAAVEQIEDDALRIEMEWGTGRNLYGMEIDGDLPPALLQARAALAATPAKKSNSAEFDGIKTSAPVVLPETAANGMRLVNSGALQMVINALRRDAVEGKAARGEMADELLAGVSAPAAKGVRDE